MRVYEGLQKTERFSVDSHVVRLRQKKFRWSDMVGDVLRLAGAIEQPGKLP